MSLTDDVMRAVRRDAAAKQKVLTIAQRIFGAMDAQEMGASAESSHELALKMLAQLGITPGPRDDISLQLLDVYTQGWLAGLSNQGRPYRGPAPAAAPLPPGIRVPDRNNRLIGERSSMDSAGTFMDRYLNQE